MERNEEMRKGRRIKQRTGIDKGGRVLKRAGELTHIRGGDYLLKGGRDTFQKGMGRKFLKVRDGRVLTKPISKR